MKKVVIGVVLLGVLGILVAVEALGQSFPDPSSETIPHEDEELMDVDDPNIKEHHHRCGCGSHGSCEQQPVLLVRPFGAGAITATKA